ncbi:MAG: Holliday junction resolvase RuvX [Flavobacteriales bacterium]
MGRVLAFDYGTKRVGIAATDPNGIIATAVGTVMVHEVFPFLKKYLVDEQVDRFVVGDPRQSDNSPSESAPAVEEFVARLKREYPAIPIDRIDERFTSKLAQRSLIDSGVRKMERRDKGLVDQVSAVLILQSWMETRRD